MYKTKKRHSSAGFKILLHLLSHSVRASSASEAKIYYIGFQIARCMYSLAMDFDYQMVSNPVL